ncbi:hypothetical protein BJY01DRAFT_210005 [Aspergillus pseudoustus]|uniref:Uncharacterized protein n=1 Tax=Aspergillus pseudoustus TaxID=1810923 RepID=A0ABR4KDG0_9EURO
MKTTPPRPASVLDVDESGNPILSSKRSAARVTKKRHSDPGSRAPHTKQEEAKATTKTKSPQSAAPPTVIVGTSRCRGSIAELAASYKETVPLTIFSTSKDHSEQRNKVEGACFRKIFLTDETEILNPDAAYERQRYVKLVILISHQDEIHETPTIFAEQHLYGPKEKGEGGQEQAVVVHELMFGTSIRLGVEYVFPGCGDENRAFGKRDLFIRFQSLDASVFSQYIQRARYYGYDRHEVVQVTKHSLATGIEYDAVPLQGTTEVSPFKGYIEGGDLSSLLKVKKDSPAPVERYKDHGIELIKLTFRGFGRWTKDRQYGGNLVLYFVYTPQA